MRFEDSPELFGCGVGTSTCGDIECEICGTKYNEGADASGVYREDAIPNTEFAGMIVCECCFEKIENEIWRRRKDIIPWITRRVKHLQSIIDDDKKMLAELSGNPRG